MTFIVFVFLVFGAFVVCSVPAAVSLHRDRVRREAARLADLRRRGALVQGWRRRTPSSP
jgi:hypothetical protein